MDHSSQLDSAIPELGVGGGRVGVIDPSNLAEQLMPHGVLSEIRSAMPRHMPRAEQTQQWYDDAMKAWNKRRDTLSAEMAQEEQLYGNSNNRASYKKMKERLQQLEYNKEMIEDTKDLMDRVDEPLLLITTHRPLAASLGNPLAWDVQMWRQIVCERGGNRMLHLIDGSTRSITNWDLTTMNQNGYTKSQCEAFRDSTLLITDQACLFGCKQLLAWGVNGIVHNTWAGYTVEPCEFGRGAPTAMCATLALWLHHAAVHICNSNFKLFQNFMSWCCFIFQQPDVKPGFAPVLVSKVEGVGKGCLLAPLHEILGKHSVTFNGIGDMVNQFNTAIKDKKLIIAHEVDMQVQRGGGDRNSPMGTLKGLVTDRSVMLTAKYAESEQALSRTALALTSNKTNAGLDVGENSRRWQFFEPWDRRLPDHIGQLISGDDGSPRSQVFLSQLLHLFCTLDCNENRARNIMHVNQTFHAEAGPLQQRFPFIKSLVEAVEASKTNAALALNKKIGVASLLRHRRGLAGNPDVALESDLAVQAGITIAPINTVRDRLRALQCGIEDTEPAFTALKEFRMWVLKRLEDDEDIAWMNVNRDEFLELVKSQDKRTLMPACTDGWRAFVQVITNKPYDHILSVLDSSINRGDADVCAEFTDRCHEEATTTGDRMWREVLDGIHWVEYNCREDSGVYSPVWRVGNEQRGMPLLELPEEAKLPRTARLLRMIVDGANATGHYEEPGAINQVIGAIATHLADIEEEDGADGAPLEEHLCKAFDQISPLTQVGPDLLKNVRASHKRTTCLFVRMIELPAFDVSLVQRRAGTNWTAVVEAIIKEEDGADDEVDEEEHMQMIAALIEETDARPEIMKLLVPGCKLDLTLKDWNAVAYFLTNNIALTRPFSGREASLLTYTTSTFRQFWDQFLPGRESPQELDVLLWGDIYLFIKDVCSRIKDGVLVVRFTYDFDWYHVWSMVHDY